MKQGELAIAILYQHKGEIPGDSGTFHSAMGSTAETWSIFKSSNIKANSSCSKIPWQEEGPETLKPRKHELLPCYLRGFEDQLFQSSSRNVSICSLLPARSGWTVIHPNWLWLRSAHPCSTGSTVRSKLTHKTNNCYSRRWTKELWPSRHQSD